MRRSIDLQPVEGSPYVFTSGTPAIPPSVRVDLSEFGESVVYAHVLISGLQQLSGPKALPAGGPDRFACYSLHLRVGLDETGPAAVYPLYLNSDWAGTLHLRWQLVSSGPPVHTVFTEPHLTAVLVIEPDDGQQFDPSIQQPFVVFRGTSSL